MIKSFEEFNSNTTTVEEGLFGAFKVRKQILEVQRQVVEAYEKLIEENPEKFKNGESVLKAVEQFARNAYKKIVTEKDALSFSQWWKDFEKSQSYLLDRTIFNK